VRITSIKGFRDVLPAEAEQRRRIVRSARRVLESYGYEEVELPLLERSELFQRSVGATSDIVEKEMYSFEDRDGDRIALRPEGTASVVRAYLEAGMARSHPISKLYYVGPMFRRDRPQKGRFRQFTQIGAECLGREDPDSDAEVVCLLHDLFEDVGIASARIEINSLGDRQCRPAHRTALLEYVRRQAPQLCADCRERLDRNPLRLLDCKQEGCQAAMREAPVMQDFLCEPCRAYHRRVLELLAALQVPVTPNPRMVRGLDYYTRTAVEIRASGLGAQDAMGGGGRYDGLVAELGGPEMGGIGFALGLERMQLAVGDLEASASEPSLFVAPLGIEATAPALALARRLRKAARQVEVGASDRRLKAQLQRADKLGARYVVILGEQELASGRATVRDLVARSDRPGCFGLGDDAESILRSLEGDTGS
jgi:histidyl-tRNA synthetase